jgi:MoxR-like ATPase
MRARVKGGRWVLDEPTDLPEGTEVEILTRPVKAPGEVYLDGKLREYIHALLVAGCSPAYSVGGGAGPEDEAELAEGAKAKARAANRAFVTPEDIKSAAPDVLRRLVVVPAEARARNVSLDDAIQAILRNTAPD